MSPDKAPSYRWGLPIGKTEDSTCTLHGLYVTGEFSPLYQTVSSVAFMLSDEQVLFYFNKPPVPWNEMFVACRLAHTAKNCPVCLDLIILNSVSINFLNQLETCK